MRTNSIGSIADAKTIKVTKTPFSGLESARLFNMDLGRNLVSAIGLGEENHNLAVKHNTST